MKLAILEPRLAAVAGKQNFETVVRTLDAARLELGAEDVLLLPEHFDARNDANEYDAGVRQLALRYGCHVVGGSHHALDAASRINRGIVVAPDGTQLAKYEKLRPYGGERAVVSPGAELGEVQIAGHRVLVLICADFWFSDLFERARHLPDLVLVPALSVTRKDTPAYSRALWHHLAVARAYEFGTFIGISDWAADSQLIALPARGVAGVAGFADPTQLEPAAFFSPVRPLPLRIFELDFDRLGAFRQDRIARGFFWRQPGAL